MKTGMKLFAAAAAAFIIGITAGNYAVSDVPSGFKAAVIDVQKVAAESSRVKALTKEQAAKREELSKFVKKASDDIKKETNETKKKALEEKYNKEFKKKQEEMIKSYEAKLLDIDKEITALINRKAKEGGYSIVLTKGAVLSGGTDITNEIVKAVK